MFGAAVKQRRCVRIGCGMAHSAPKSAENICSSRTVNKTVNNTKGILMDYREAAKELLAKKIELKNAYVSLGDEITMLENEKFAIRKCVGDTAVAAGGGSKYEEYITNLIFISDNTSLRRRVVRRELDMIEQGMAELSEYEQDLMDVFFVRRAKNATEIIAEKWFKERSQIYSDRAVALNKSTRAVYGVIHL